MLLALLLPALAHAADGERIDLARRHYQAASAYFEQGRYDDAVREFRESYELSRAVDLLYNIGQCYLRKQDAARAVDYYRRYLAGKPEALDRGAVEHTIVGLMPRIGTLRLTELPDGAQIYVDGAPVGETPLGPIPATQGTVRVDARLADGSVRTAEARVTAGAETELALPPPKERVIVEQQVVEKVKVVKEQVPHWWTYRPGWAVVGAGAVLLVGGVPLQVLAVQQANQAEAAASEHLFYRHRSNAVALRASGIAATVAGVATLGVAAALFTVHYRRESKQSVAVRVVPAGLGLAASGSF